MLLAPAGQGKAVGIDDTQVPTNSSRPPPCLSDEVFRPGTLDCRHLLQMVLVLLGRFPGTTHNDDIVR
jgi:hypothetical protein